MTEFLDGLLISTVSGGVLAALLLFAKPFVKDKMSKRGQYFSWNLVLFRMLLPFSVGIFAVGSLTAFVHNPAYQAANGSGSSTTQSAISSTVVSPGSTVSPIFSPVGVNSAVTSPVSNVHFRLLPVRCRKCAANVPQTANAVQPAQHSSFFVDHWQTLLFILWLIGVLVILGIHIAGYIRYASKIKASRVKIEDSDTLALLKECSEKYGLTKPLPLYVSYVTDTPMLCGMFRCSVVLPNREFTPEQLRYAFLHEFAHCRRHDNLLKWIAVLAVSLNWFNPAVYLAAREAGRLCELSCDEIVIKGFSREQRIDYGRTLLSVASDSVRKPMALSATMSEDKRSLKERLEMLTKMNKKSKRNAIFTVSAVFAAVAITGFSLMVSGEKKPLQPEQSSESNTSDSSSGLTDSSITSPVDSNDVDSTSENIGASSQTDSNVVPQSNVWIPITNSINNDLKAKYSDINITSEWNAGYPVVFGSLKSDPRQGVAVIIDNQDNTDHRYLTPSKHGAVTAQSLLESAGAAQVSAADGHIWIFIHGYGFYEEGEYTGPWEQIDNDMHLIEGTVVSLKKNTDDTAFLSLKMNASYLYDRYGYEDRKETSSTQEFVLQKLPEFHLDTGEDIVIYTTGADTPLSKERFDAAAVLYYKKGDKYMDMNGKTAAIPPQDCPEFNQLFDSVYSRFPSYHN